MLPCSDMAMGRLLTFSDVPRSVHEHAFHKWDMAHNII
jgi:hypothetical protein